MIRSPNALPVTGFALANALGNDRDAVRAALAAGVTGLTPNEIPVPFPTFSGAVDLDLPELPTALSGWSTRSARLAAHLLTALEEPLARMRGRWRPDRIAILLGTSTAGADATEAAYKQYIQTNALPDEYDLWRHHTYGAILHVVRELSGANGPAWMVSTACTSSAKVIGSARRLIQADIVDAAIVGGIDTLCAMTLTGFYSLGALSETLCRPFSSERAGINIGEGGAFLLLERKGEAEALLEGVGESSDAYHISAPHPEGRGAADAMQRALDQAGISAADIDHINAHGTGTRLNDSAESRAIHQLFGDQVPVVSTKAYTGHTLGAAGGTEAALSIMALQDGWIPSALGANPVDEAISIFLPQTKTTGGFNRVLSNSFAFGGNNTSVVLRAI